MPLEEDRLASLSNLAIAIRYPIPVLSWIWQGRIGGYRKILSKILATLSKATDQQVRAALAETISTGKLIMPRKLNLFNESIGLVPQVLAYYMTRSYYPQLVVETGVWTGKTSWFILQALEDNEEGELTSIDLGLRKLENDLGHPENLPIKEIGGLVPQQLRSRWQLLIGDSVDILPRLAVHSNNVDLFLHDSNHSYQFMTFEFRTMWPLIRPGGFLCSDDIGGNSAWVDFLASVGHSGSSVQSRFGICRKQ